ncbi:hypothetical protein KW790_01650 [Candidatus Parcubacteria bacterium]|nr:hypothetical protein [Candidatus Parcubacteria bacterium]
MSYVMENEWISVTEGDVQRKAFILLGRKLTTKEIEDAEDRFLEQAGQIYDVIDQSINYAVIFNDLLRRSKNAESSPVYYSLDWKNTNAFQDDYKRIFTSPTEDDIREYIFHQHQPGDQFKITHINNGKETLIDEIGQEYIDQLN